MIDSTLADLRSSKNFFDTDEIIHVFDGRKKEEIGYFVPKFFAKEFEAFLHQLELKHRREKLHRISKAQKLDPIEEGGIDDGL